MLLGRKISAPKNRNSFPPTKIMFNNILLFSLSSSLAIISIAAMQLPATARSQRYVTNNEIKVIEGRDFKQHQGMGGVIKSERKAQAARGEESCQ
jgi:hypothetical protein